MADRLTQALLALIFLGVLSNAVVIQEASKPADFPESIQANSPNTVDKIQELVDRGLATEAELDSKLDESTFTAEDFAQESTLSSILADTNAINSVQTQTVKNADILTEAHLPFGGLAVRTFENLIHIESDEGTVVSETRNDVTENGGTVTKEDTLYKITGTAKMETDRLTEYMAGAAAQVGIGLRVNRDPKPGESVKFGAFNDNTGIFYKVNSTCTSVNLLRDGETAVSVCQEDWNQNPLNGTTFPDPNTGEEVNREGYKLSIHDLNIYQFVYAWYGAGTVQYQIIADNEGFGQAVENVHFTDFKNNTSIQETSLPITVEVIDNNGSEDFSVSIGGRQHSILSEYSPASRKTTVYRNSVTVSAANQWEHILSVRHRPNFKNINLDVVTVSGNFGCDAEWAVYRNTNKNITEPFGNDFFYASPDETSMLVNKNATISFTGSPRKALADEALLIDSGQFASGGNKNDFSRQQSEVRTTISRNETVSWFIRGSGGATCTHNSLQMTIDEDW